MRKLITFGLVAMASLPVQADIYEQIGACKKTEDAAKQLECFKALPDKPEEKAGLWTKEIDKSPIDDSKVVIVSSEAVVSAGKKSAMLMLRCKEATPEFMVATDMFFGLMEKDGVSITYRLDDDKAIEQKWGSNPEGKVLFAADSKAFINDVLVHKQLTMRLQEYSGNKHDMVFNLSGLPEQMTEFKEVCKLN